MLSPAQIAIINATVPILETGGEALTTHFYQLLFKDYPEVRPLFNQVNQVSGAQPRALANGVLMYAKNIEKLENLGPLAGQIINKHVALQILPEHYPLVGSSLLKAIREVLGAEVATDAVIDAWAAAYQQLADILMNAEKQIYDNLAAAPGGWRGGRKFRVERKVAESSEITSFYFEPVDGMPVLQFKPGQYIGIRLHVDGQDLRRNYSLSAASNGKGYRISVKRQEGGVASCYLHDRTAVGDTVELYTPSGEFTLEESGKPLVLISGGVGITPTLAMAEAALDGTERQITFIHYARNADVHAFRELVNGWRNQYSNFKAHIVYAVSEPGDAHQPDGTGHLSIDQLKPWLPDSPDFDAYFLGPKPFMAGVKRVLQQIGVPDTQSHYEFFGPAEALESVA